MAILLIILASIGIARAEVDYSDFWVNFRDKGEQTSKFRLSDRAVKRRKLRGTNSTIDDSIDLPIDENQIAEVLKIGAKLRSRSRWLNAIGVTANSVQIAEIEKLLFVKSIEPIRGFTGHKYKSFSPSPLTDKSPNAPTPAGFPPIDPSTYGSSWKQISQVQADRFHKHNLYGKDIFIGLLDTGFNLRHEAIAKIDLIDRYDFVNGDENTADEADQDDSGQELHGSEVLAVLAGNAPGKLIGVAPEASYLLAKTEKNSESGVNFERQIEEDWWIEGLEWLEANGADVVNSSLGYSDWYNFSQLDGKTSKMTIVADLAVERGVVIVTAAGNQGGNEPSDEVGLKGHINVPADGFNLLAIGAVDDEGKIWAFSSPGPTADGRIKPELVAMGEGVTSINARTTAGYSDRHRGTSMATPIVTGIVALLLESFPLATPHDIATALRSTATQSENPDNRLGYGIAQGWKAYEVLLEQFGETGFPKPVSVELRSGFFPMVFGKLKDRNRKNFASSPELETALLPNFPNPFKGETWIAFNLKNSSNVIVRIYDIKGISIRKLDFGEMAAGRYATKELAIHWDGRSDSGEQVSRGIYFYQMIADNFSATRKMLIAK